MPRRSRKADAACLFCGRHPCGCDGQPAIEPAVVESPPRASILDRLENLIEGSSPRYIMSDQEYATLAAVRCFADVFEIEGDLDSYRPHLEQPASLSERIATWRHRHGVGEGG